MKYPVVQKYLKHALGVDVTGWALCYTHRSFNSGIQSTQCVETYNSLIKRSIKTSTMLYDLDIKIQLQLDKEEQFEQKEQLNQNLTVGLSNVHRQIMESLLYHVQKIEDWENLINDLDDADFYKLYNSDHEDMINPTNDISFAEDEYESVISNLDSLIKYIDWSTIQEYNETIYDPQEEVVITIIDSSYPNIFRDRQTESISPSKIYQGLGYAKKAVGLALKTGRENELNKLLRDWINETERKTSYNLN
ncbi:226_t:CDS:2, partial [Cetraspora pellucida]